MAQFFAIYPVALLILLVAAAIWLIWAMEADNAWHEKRLNSSAPAPYSAKHFENLKAQGYTFHIEGERNRLIATHNNPTGPSLRKRVYALHTVPLSALATI